MPNEQMSIRVAVCLMLVLGSIPKDAISKTLTGNELYEICTSSAVEDRLSCGYYIKGVWDTVSLLAGLYEQVGPLCMPGDIALQQLVDSTIDYLKNNPAHRHGRADVHVMAAIVQTWPCSP